MGTGQERFRLLISDGVYQNSFSMLASQLNHLIHEKKLENYTIVKVCFKHFFYFTLIWLILFISLFWLFKLFFFGNNMTLFAATLLGQASEIPWPMNSYSRYRSVCMLLFLMLLRIFFSVLYYNKSFHSRSIILSMWNLNHINNYKLFLFYSFTKSKWSSE